MNRSGGKVDQSASVQFGRVVSRARQVDDRGLTGWSSGQSFGNLGSVVSEEGEGKTSSCGSTSQFQDHSKADGTMSGRESRLLLEEEEVEDEDEWDGVRCRSNADRESEMVVEEE